MCLPGLLPPHQPLNLLNVSFQQAGGGYETPDRVTAVQSYRELRALHPNRPLALTLVDVTLAELQAQRAQRVRHLLLPAATVLDDSIGCAVWFAARGRGWDWETDRPVESAARVLLLGMGADELLGGYSRHRATAARDGMTALAAELKRELLNIPERNLGRDNRIVADHGVAPRFPFLDEDLVNFLLSTPVSLRSNYNYERGIGEKLLLRLAVHRFGLKLTAKEPKRAVQFGSRIAKMENRKEKACDIAKR